MQVCAIPFHELGDTSTATRAMLRNVLLRGVDGRELRDKNCGQKV